MDAELSNPENNSEPSSGRSLARNLEQSPAGISVDPPHDSKTCPHCGTVLPLNAAFCPGCGWSMTPLTLEDRAVAAAAYFTLIPAAVILFLPMFRKHRFVRFHAWQSILLWGLFLVLTIIALVVSNVASPMILLLFGILAILAMAFLWAVLSIKAWQGERFELPVFGKLAVHLK